MQKHQAPPMRRKNEFRPGDIVILKRTGLECEVLWQSEDLVATMCMWLNDDGDLFEVAFRSNELKLK